jgi:hypothetical protein
MKGALKCTGKILNGRAISIKISKRNITNKKRESDMNIDDEINFYKKKKVNQEKDSSEKKNWNNEDFLKLMMKKNN